MTPTVAPIESLLAALNCERLSDVLFVLPSRYDGYSSLARPGELKRFAGQSVALRARVIEPVRQVESRPARMVFVVTDGIDRIDVQDFGFADHSPWTALLPGDEVLLSGKIKYRPFYGLALHSPKRLEEGGEARFLPVYKGRPGRISGDKIASLVGRALIEVLPDAVSTLKARFGNPDESALLRRCNLHQPLGDEFPSIEALFKAMHAPEREHDGQRAAVSARNLSIYAAYYQARRGGRREQPSGAAIPIPAELIRDLEKRLPFPITQGQRDAGTEIWKDVTSPYRMHRILMGEVGSGKTVPIAILASAAQLIGRQVVMLYPNTVLARQVEDDIRRWFPHVAIESVVANQRPTLDRLRAKPILIGTTAVINFCGKHGIQADLLIVDESQKTGRAQRESLLAPHTNLLEATATCLPRTAALVIYGNLPVSRLTEQPVKKTITTRIVRTQIRKQADWMFRNFRQAVLTPGKVAVIVPKVEPQKVEEGASAAATKYHEKRAVTTAVAVWEEVFPGRVVGLHGRMKAAEKEAAITAMNTNMADCIVATSLLEVGITIKRLKAAVVLDADLYGVSTLHQMRGRLVRDGGAGLFCMVPRANATEDAMERLHLLELTSDGTALAEKDLERRGFGDLASDGDLQSGAAVTLFQGIALFPKDVEDLLKSSPNRKA